MVRLGVAIQDEQYRKRLTVYLIRHYAGKIALELLAEDHWNMLLTGDRWDALLLEGAIGRELIAELQKKDGLSPVGEDQLFFLRDEENGGILPAGLVALDKYQDVNAIAECILRQAVEAGKSAPGGRALSEKMVILGVYSLEDGNSQLPFSLMLAQLLGEKRRVLFLDLQENSGFGALADKDREAGLEELFVMIESGRYSGKRLLAAIGHGNGTDYVYPVQNSENLCEIREGTIQTLLELLARESDYELLVISFGARFCGFFDALRQCDRIFWLQSSGSGGGWRREAFREELCMRKCDFPEEKLVSIELQRPEASSLSRQIELWKWGEPGDMLRRFALENMRKEEIG